MFLLRFARHATAIAALTLVPGYLHAQGNPTAGVSPRPTAAAIKASLVDSVMINPMARILKQGKQLQLNNVKVLDSLSYLNRWFIIRLDSIWTPVAQDLADRPDSAGQAQAYAKYRAAHEASYDLLIKIAPDVRGFLTEEQLRTLGATARYLDVQYLRSIR